MVKALKIDSELEDEFRDIYEKCIAVARPKAVFCLVPVHQEGGADEIGLELTDSCLMLPYKSVSGIAYETETTFENCMLYPWENCPTRRASYDASMGAKTYHMSESDRLHSTDDLVGWLTTMPVMGEVVEKAVEADVRDKVKIMIGGAPVAEAFGQSTNADAYTPDATTCAEVAMQLLAS